MGFLDTPGLGGFAGGANQSLQNFMQFYMQKKELEQRKLLEQERLREYRERAQALEALQRRTVTIAENEAERKADAEMRELNRLGNYQKVISEGMPVPGMGTAEAAATLAPYGGITEDVTLPSVQGMMSPGNVLPPNIPGIQQPSLPINPFATQGQTPTAPQPRRAAMLTPQGAQAFQMLESPPNRPLTVEERVQAFSAAYPEKGMIPLVTLEGQKSKNDLTPKDVLRGKWTPESLRKYIQTRNLADLEPMGGEGKSLIKTEYNMKDPSKTRLVLGAPGYVSPEGWSLNEPPQEKTPTIIERITNDLRQKLGRPPTDAEILEEDERRQIRITGGKSKASMVGQLEGQRSMLLDDKTIADYAKYVVTAGEFPPEFGRLFRLPAVQTDAIKRVTALLEDQGYSGAERAVQAASYKAGKVSLNFQEKQLGAARSFVMNLEGQTKRVEEIMQDVINRVGVRAIDLPRREMKTRFIGSGHEQALASYLLEISREIGKLTSGSQASVAELSVEAQKKWDKIHDPNLSLKELKIILQTTNEQARIRIKSMEDAVNAQLERMGQRRSEIPALEVPSPTPSVIAGQRESTQSQPIVSTKTQKPIPQEAIDRLKKNPKEAALFDMTFGSGMSRKVLGGQ